MQEPEHVRTDNEYKQGDILFAVFFFFFIRMTGEPDIQSYPFLDSLFLSLSLSRTPPRPLLIYVLLNPTHFL